MSGELVGGISHKLPEYNNTTTLDHSLGHDHRHTRLAQPLTGTSNADLLQLFQQLQQGLDPAKLEEQVMYNWTQQFEERLDILKQPVWRGIILAIYVSIIVIGVIGNGIVVYIVARNKNMHNITNIFIANLALSDIGLCVFCLPIQLHYQITDKWIFGECLCRVIFAAFAVPMYVSTLTILLIAFDRYWLIVYPLRNRMTLQTAFILLAVSALLSIILAIPVIVFSTITDIEEPHIELYRTFCIERWPNPSGRIVYTILIFLFQFCLPLAMTAVLYYRIHCRLSHRPVHRVNNIERKRKTNKILVAIVTLFVICWLPWNLFSLLVELDRDIVKGPHFKFVDLLLKAFAMGSACINPFLYCWLNDNFRKELDSMAIRLHIYRQRPSSRGRSVPTYKVEPPGDNATLNSPDTAFTAADRISTAQVTHERISVAYYPHNPVPDNTQCHNGQHQVLLVENHTNLATV